MPFNGCFYVCLQTASLSNIFTRELKQEAGREWGISTWVHIVVLILQWLYPRHSLAVLRIKLFQYYLDTNYILIKKEWQSEDNIILTIQLPWKLPSFSFPWQEIIPVFFVMLNSLTPLALFSCVGLALKNRTWHLVSSQLKRYQFLDLMSAVPRSKARNIKVDIYYLFHGLHQWCFSLSFFVIIADVLPIMLRSLLKSVCPLQTNIHINVIHQQLTNASSLQHFLHDQKPHCFCRIWVCTECRIGPRGGISEFRSRTLSPSAQQCPELAGTGSGRHCIRCLRCELLQRWHEYQALRGVKALNRLFSFSSVICLFSFYLSPSFLLAFGVLSE